MAWGPNGGGDIVTSGGNEDAWTDHGQYCQLHLMSIDMFVFIGTWHEAYGDGAWVSLSFTGEY
jgi:hypothetical protein